MNNTRQYADFRACSNIKPALFRTEMPQISTISQRRATIPPRRRSAKCVNYSKLQQRAQKRKKIAILPRWTFERGKYRTKGEVPPDRRKGGKNGRSGKGGKVRLKRVGNREREEKKGKRVKRWLQAKRKKKKKGNTKRNKKKHRKERKGKKKKHTVNALY